MTESAVVLLSGGLDSATVLAIARARGHDCLCLSFAYGQRHGVELEAAARVAQAQGAREHRIVSLDPQAFSSSALTGRGEIPKGRDTAQMDGEIPVTYVPARNIIFLSYALGVAEGCGAEYIFIGANAVDYSGYPDCRPEFIRAFEEMAAIGTKSGAEGRPISIEAPIISLSKAEIIRRGTELGVDYSLTHSCYDPDTAGLACGECDSCLLRRKGFAGAGVADPTRYRA